MKTQVGAIVQKALKPMLDETAAVSGFAGMRAQPHFERSQGAGGSEPRLCHDDGDGGQMRKAKP